VGFVTSEGLTLLQLPNRHARSWRRWGDSDADTTASSMLAEIFFARKNPELAAHNTQLVDAEPPARSTVDSPACWCRSNRALAVPRIGHRTYRASIEALMCYASKIGDGPVLSLGERADPQRPSRRVDGPRPPPRLRPWA